MPKNATHYNSGSGMLGKEILNLGFGETHVLAGRIPKSHQIIPQPSSRAQDES